MQIKNHAQKRNILKVIENHTVLKCENFFIFVMQQDEIVSDVKAIDQNWFFKDDFF